MIKSQQVSPLPQGAWSPIVTGALPAEAQAQAPPEERGRFVQNEANQPVGSPRAPRTSNRIETGAVDSDPAEGKTQAGAQPTPARAAPGAAPAAGGSEPIVPRQRVLDALPPDATAAQQYCFNTADSAADARFAWQAKKIKEMEAELENRARAARGQDRGIQEVARASRRVLEEGAGKARRLLRQDAPRCGCSAADGNGRRVGGGAAHKARAEGREPRHGGDHAGKGRKDSSRHFWCGKDTA